MTCPCCGHEIAIGDWPFCPDHTPGTSNARQDAFIGGLTLENLGPTPVTVYSRSELRRELRARGLEECIRHVPVPGSDKSPHTTNWSAPSAYALEQAKVLAERQAHTKGTNTPPDAIDPAIRAEVARAFQELS